MKKEHLKKWISVFLSMLVLIFCSGFQPAIQADPIAQYIPLEIREEMAAQKPALDTYTVFSENVSKMSMSSSFHIQDTYAGEYVENGKLIVQLTDVSPKNVELYQTLAGNSDAIAFEQVEYSMEELQELKQDIDNLTREMDIISYGLDVRNNRCMITVSEEDYNELMKSNIIKENREVFNIICGGEAIPCSTSLRGGDKITPEGAVEYMTVGIGGTFVGNPAILTAGHMTDMNISFSYNGTQIGKVSYVRANSVLNETGIHSYGDFSIITLNNNFQPTNLVKNNISSVPISGTYSSIPVGTGVYKYGATTGYSWGTVSYVDVYANYTVGGTYYIRGLYQSLMTKGYPADAVDAGDSGGPVYIQSGNSYKLHGIVSGCYYRDTYQTMMYSSPIGYAENTGESHSFVVKTTN